MGMSQNKDWALLANYCDKTLLRTAIAFKTSSIFEMNYTPDAKFVELIMNEEYMGNYQLTETVKEGKNRVNVGDNGFLIEHSNYDDEPVKFVSQQGVIFQFKYPDPEEITQEQITAIQNDIDSFESILFSDDSTAFDEISGYRNMIDVEEWAKWFLVQNVIYNKDTNKYYYKSSTSSKICMGPVWDFEWSLGIGWYYGERPNPNHELLIFDYFERLLQDEYFKGVIKTIWNKYKLELNRSILDFFDSTTEYLDKSQKLNFVKWNILDKQVSVGGIPLGTYEKEVACDKQYFINHFAWLDNEISNW